MKKYQLKVINPVPDVSLLGIAPITQGMLDPRRKREHGFTFDECFTSYENEFLEWRIDARVWKRFGCAIFKRVRTNPLSIGVNSGL